MMFSALLPRDKWDVYKSKQTTTYRLNLSLCDTLVVSEVDGFTHTLDLSVFLLPRIFGGALLFPVGWEGGVLGEGLCWVRVCWVKSMLVNQILVCYATCKKTIENSLAFFPSLAF